jgi:hypothetical protein
LPSALATLVWLLAAAAPAEPGLAETQAAAARAAGGSAAEDESRAERARISHWAPQLRAQGLLRDDEKSREGVYRLAPIQEQDLGVGHTWSVVLSWDFSQVVYAREESQIALASAHLARLRREAAEKATRLWIERRTALARFTAATPYERPGACLALLALTAELDALTDGLFRESVSREETACLGEPK